MKSFLEHVAEDIISKYGTNLSRTAVVFPNKRASLFLNEHLARLSKGKPLWSPAYITISELFRVCDLYQSFRQFTGSEETLDKFFGWGQLLISDFDDIDKNMADANHVFANLRDIHELDDLSFLTDEQRELLRHFFSHFTEEHETELKQRFLRLWSHLADIYHDFNRRLTNQGLAYEGALYRQVVTSQLSPLTTHSSYDHYLFVGFNLLQKVEQQLFSELQKAGKARFYWDFDDYYMQGHEAGHYIAQYLRHFPNELNTSLSANRAYPGTLCQQLAEPTAHHRRSPHRHRPLRRAPVAHRHPQSARRGSEGKHHYRLPLITDSHRLFYPVLLRHGTGWQDAPSGARLPSPSVLPLSHRR